MSILATFTPQVIGVFGDLVSVQTVFVDGAPDLAVVVANDTGLTLTIGTTANLTTVDWDTIAGLFNADSGAFAIASMAGAIGQNALPLVLAGPVQGGWAGQGQGQFFFSVGVTPPVPPSTRKLPQGGGHIRQVRTFVNSFDVCLARDYQLYDCIDPQAFACARRPLCFCQDERDWGGNWGEAEEITLGPPKGAIAFNPTGSVPLPSPSDGDVVIFQFVVPKGYDGIILGQYHQYSPKPLGNVVTPFVEGSGDLIWRISAASRFVRDCGHMTVSLGSARALSPVAGGIQLRANNLVQYIINAPDPSGTLAPGLGSINAGLHGYFWPRR